MRSFLEKENIQSKKQQIQNQKWGNSKKIFRETIKVKETSESRRNDQRDG